MQLFGQSEAQSRTFGEVSRVLHLAVNDARTWSANGHHSHGLKWMFMYKQGRKVKFQIWSTIMHTAVKL
ncbi:hypothetical protein K443DRAFT_117425 [Laccaria amethystina LaAM-08-1]|uniref:Uncharacterized protein n=1 Tax=Laccaria amethystina LaAM-08-1 TaxID=1095629 RepID=A0A0C9WL01_9AGAR|nr:hypothetical protein K443DRAFT_117425 [Laccaria amethystina LaAM-08-1]